MPLRQFFTSDPKPNDRIDDLPSPPPWRRFNEQAKQERGEKFHPSEEVIELVNAALLLRRPLLVTGKPGTGKSSLAFAVAYQLGLGKVLQWSITTRSTLQQGLYTYDAIARLQDASLMQARRSVTAGGNSAPIGELAEEQQFRDIGKYIRLGPLGTSMLPGKEGTASNGRRPRVLLIDEIDKSDIDLPNDLLSIFEEGEFEIPELGRLPEESRFDKVEVLPYDSDDPVWIERGRVRCENFPFVVMTSNEEREFPPAFLRRCLRLDVKPPTDTELVAIVRDRLSEAAQHDTQLNELLRSFLERRDERKQDLATDQLLNAMYLVVSGLDLTKRSQLLNAVFRSLSGNR